MAAKLGSRVGMLTKLGKDTFGEGTLRNLERFGVDTRHVHFTADASSGVAPIMVDPDARNAIVIVTGANDLLTVAEIEAARADIASAAVLVCQLEIPLELNLAAMRVARSAGVRTVFNPAPARAELPMEAYPLSDVFCPNESEAELLTGLPVATDAQAEAAARVLLARGAGSVVLTRGSRGSLVANGNHMLHLPAQRVQAVDSTGAGDAYVGSLAHFLARGSDLTEAARRAGAIATRSVLKPGTQTSFPSAEEVADLL
jgi:ribokinase